MKTFIHKLALGFVIALAAPATALLAQPIAPNALNQRSVSVTGEGIVRVAPDLAIIRFGVVTVAPTPQEARQQNAEAAREAMNAVRALGIEERNIQLETLRLQQAREYDPETRRWRELGFEAIRDVVVRVENLDLLPELVANVVEEGANRLHGIEYDLKDRDAARNAALREAVANAREKAVLLASTLDVDLGQVLHVTEQSFNFPRPVFRQMEMAAMAKADVAESVPEAYAAGEIEVQTTVQVMFGLE